MTSRRKFIGLLCLPAIPLLIPAWGAAQTLNPSNTPAVTGVPEGLPPTPPAQALKLANNIHLAYVRTSSSAVNDDAQRGLQALADELRERTTIKAQGALAVDLDKDDLSFFRFLYWPVTPDAAPLSERARQNIRRYINNGGVVLIDARAAHGEAPSMRAVRRVTDGLGIAPLEKVTKDHTLANQFYKELQGGLPGSSSYNPVEAEISDIENGGRPTSVIIGSNNWGDAWAGKTLLKGTDSYEAAMRSGIHLVRHAYTGYARSIPVEKILEGMKR